MTDYPGRHRPLTRVERRALERRDRLPRSLAPVYAVPTAAAVALVLTAAGATAAQSSCSTGDSSPAQTTFAGQDAAALLEDPELARSARTEGSDASVDTAGLAERRQAASVSVALDQGRSQERERVARDSARKNLASRKKVVAQKKRVAEKKRVEAQSAASAPTTTAPTGGNTASSAAGAEGWVKPLDNAVFTSPFGHRWGKLHAGQDYAAPIGTPLKAMSSGTVVGAGPMSGYGIYIDVEYWDGSVSRYGHLSSVSATVGQQVATGDVIALSGNTGHSTGPHLHVEIHPGGGAPIDPAGWLAERGIG